MKKIVLMFVALAAISFASCGGNKAQAPATTDSDSTMVDSLAGDSVVADSAATVDSAAVAK